MMDSKLKIDLIVDDKGSDAIKNFRDLAVETQKDVGKAIDETNKKIAEQNQELKKVSDAAKNAPDIPKEVQTVIDLGRIAVAFYTAPLGLASIIDLYYKYGVKLYKAIDHLNNLTPTEQAAKLEKLAKELQPKIDYFQKIIDIAERSGKGGQRIEIRIATAWRAELARLKKLQAEYRASAAEKIRPSKSGEETPATPPAPPTPQPQSDKAGRGADAVAANIAYGRKMLDEIEQENMRGLAQYATGMATAFEDLDLFNRIFAPKEGDEFNLTREYQAWAEQAGQEFAETFQGYGKTASDTDLPGKVAFSENLEKDLADLPVYVRQASEEAGDAYQRSFLKDMERATRQTAYNLNSIFGDIFFDAFRGELKDLGDYWDAFLLGMERNLADSLGRQAAQLLTGYDIAGGGRDWGLIGDVVSLGSSLLGGNSGGSIVDTAVDLGKKAVDFVSGFFQTGTPYVPRTMTALVHQGERIFSAVDNQTMTAGMVTLANSTRASLYALDSIAENTYHVASNTASIKETSAYSASATASALAGQGSSSVLDNLYASVGASLGGDTESMIDIATIGIRGSGGNSLSYSDMIKVSELAAGAGKFAAISLAKSGGLLGTAALIAGKITGAFDAFGDWIQSQALSLMTGMPSSYAIQGTGILANIEQNPGMNFDPNGGGVLPGGHGEGGKGVGGVGGIAHSIAGLDAAFGVQYARGGDVTVPGWVETGEIVYNGPQQRAFDRRLARIERAVGSMPRQTAPVIQLVNNGVITTTDLDAWWADRMHRYNRDGAGPQVETKLVTLAGTTLTA